MKTRFSALVQLKKDMMQKSERALERTNANINSANTALELSYKSLQEIETPKTGTISDLLASRQFLDSARHLIVKNYEWIKFAEEQQRLAKEKFQADTIEYEKFNYLEVEEQKKLIKLQKIAEAKELDEIALMTYKKKF
jgi:flagellar biosynthesis chaperone FliJ